MTWYHLWFQHLVEQFEHSETILREFLGAFVLGYFSHLCFVGGVINISAESGICVRIVKINKFQDDTSYDVLYSMQVYIQYMIMPWPPHFHTLAIFASTILTTHIIFPLSKMHIIIWSRCIYRLSLQSSCCRNTLIWISMCVLFGVFT